MYTLNNGQLEVSILDPVADQVHLGARYVTGGYIWQVTDSQHGPLLSGPVYPNPNPITFHGQGLPEAFFNALSSGKSTAGDTETVLVLGVGLVEQATVERPERHRQVSQFCEWSVAQSAGRVTMTTEHAIAEYAAEIVRDVLLVERTVRSTTTLRNTGRADIDFRWFPHPFFPLVPNGEAVRFSLPVSFPENSGYAMRSDGMIVRRLESGWGPEGGFFQEVTVQTPGNLAAVLRHPQVGLVGVTCDYAPGWMPIWGNGCTFSVEPYLIETVPAGKEATWSVTYDL